MKDFFISYNTKDEKWAEWVTWQIEELGFSTIMQRWDFTSGSNFVVEMHKATEYSKKIVLILSEDFLGSKFTSSEWSAFFSKDPDGSKRLIIPIRVMPCSPTGLLAQIVYLDFVDKEETECKHILSNILEFKRLKPDLEPHFPQDEKMGSLLANNYPTLKKPYGNRKNAPKRIAKEIFSSCKKSHYEPFHIQERRYGRAFLSDTLKYFLNLHFKSPSLFVNLSILVIDVDGMSGINKSHGVAVGDNVIRNIVKICSGETDRLFSGRMGDDTLFVMYKNTPERKAKEASDSLVKKIANHDWISVSDNLFVTCSVGFVEFSDLELADDALVRAIEGLIKARKDGGNRADTVHLKRDLTNFNLMVRRELEEEREIERRNRWLSMVS